MEFHSRMSVIRLHIKVSDVFSHDIVFVKVQ